MVRADWGLDLDEARFVGAEHTPFDPVDSDAAESLPEVQIALARGYAPAPEAPLWCFLPAIWPNPARAWVRDRRIRHATVSCAGVPGRRVPWSTADYLEIEQDVNATLGECGFEPRPGGRLWLLKPAPRFASLEEMLHRLSRSADAAGHDILASTAFAEHVGREVQRHFAAEL